MDVERSRNAPLSGAIISNKLDMKRENSLFLNLFIAGTSLLCLVFFLKMIKTKERGIKMDRESVRIKKAFLGLFLLFLSSSFCLSIETWQKPLEPPPVFYNLQVTLDPIKATLLGEEEIIWENRTADVISDMWFHLYWNAFKNEASAFFQESQAEAGIAAVRFQEGKWGWIDIKSIRLADGRDLKPTSQFIRQDNPNSSDETVLRIMFPEPILPGNKVQLFLSFEGKVPAQGIRAGYRGQAFFIAQWYPKPGVYEAGKGWNCHAYHLNSEFFADFANFKVSITTPANFIVGASGKEIERQVDGERQKQTVVFAADWVHDFAWTAAPDYLRFEKDFIANQEISQEELRETAALLGLNPEDVQLPDLKMILFLRPEHRHQLDRHLRALKQAIKYYGLWFGPYPYEQITLVDPPYGTGSGGMEYPTLFTAGTSLFLSPEVLSPEGVIIHEFGHNYWYGLFANNEFEEAWLDEGINTYSTGRVLARAYGPGAVSASVLGLPLAWFFRLPRYYDWQLDRATSIHIVAIDPIIRDSWKFFNRLSYGLNVYYRASTCLNTLERLIGEAKMLRGLRELQWRFRFRHPHSQDFFQVMSEVSGLELDWFYQTFFLFTKTFDYGIDSLRSWPKPAQLRGVFDAEGIKKEVGGKEVKEIEKKKLLSSEKKVFINEVTVRRFGEASVPPDFPLKIKIVFEDSSEEIRTWDGQERWVRFQIEKPSRAKLAVVDPDQVWLIDTNWANNSRMNKAKNSGVWRIAASYLWGLQNFLLILGGLI